LLMLVVDSMQRCSHPQAEEGHQVREGCLLRTCKSDTWRSSLVDNKCCYDREAYSINTTIYSSMSEDGCAKAVIDCMEETPGNAKTVLSVKNYCEDYATKDQLEEIKKMLLDQIEAESGFHGGKIEAKDHKEEPKILLIGPSLTSRGKSEVLSLPDLTPLDCNIPVFLADKSEVLSLPDLTPLDFNIPVFHGGEYHSYVGRSTSDGVLMCGGYTNIGITSSCYLLTSSGYQEMPGLINKRTDAASVVTPLGLWVTGGYDGDQVLDTTEIWSNNQCRPHVRLPERLSGQCLTTLNQTHVLLTGGYGELGSSSAVYIYSDKTGFYRIEDMNTPRKYHGCSVINDSTVLVAGGANDDYRALSSTEYLDLTSLTWSAGPELPKNVYPAQMLGPEELGPEIGGHLLIGMDYLFKLEEEGLAETKHWTKQSIELRHQKGWAGAFVVNHDMFC